jgi:hypothetical protein
MASQKEAHLATIRSIQAELVQFLDGMDYCLDWKPEDNAWSAREVVYHLLDTPPGGVHWVLRGIFSGQLKECDLWADRSNMTPERLANDADRVRQDIGRFFQGMEEAVGAAAEEDFAGKSILLHLHRLGRDETWTAQMLLERPFARHWREHVAQIGDLKASLGI